MAAFRSLDETVAALGADGPAYRRLMEPLVRDCQAIADDVLGPLRSIPGHPVAMARFGLPGLLPMEWLVRRFESEEAKALLAGVGAHAMSLTAPAHQRLRDAAGPHRPRRRLAGGGGRQFDHHRRDGHRARAARRDHHHRAVGRLPGRAPPLDGGGARHLAQGSRRHRRRRPAGPLPAVPPSVPLRPRRLQDRLGAVRTGPVERRGLPPRRDGAPRADLRRGGGQRGRRQRRAGTPSARTASSSRPGWPTPPGPRPASRRCGGTATSPPARTWT